MKKIMQIPEETVQKWVYLITIPAAIISGICALISAMLVQQEAGLFFFKIFAGVMSFIAIYSIQISKAISWKKKEDEDE